MWRTYLTEQDPPQPVTYCPDCAHREFDPWPTPPAPNHEALLAQEREMWFRVLVASVRRRKWWHYVLVAALAASILRNILEATQ
jgi:hypothetical protein